MKRFVLGFLTGGALLVFSLGSYLKLGLADFRADVAAPALVSRLMDSATHAAVRRTAPKIRNPLLPVSEETLITGGRLYLNDCVGCHGEPGKAASEFGATFYPRAPQLPQSGTRYSEAQVYWIAKYGIRRTGMAAQRFSYSDQELWSLAAFISRIRDLPPRIAERINLK